jgi:hypothetical protein
LEAGSLVFFLPPLDKPISSLNAPLFLEVESFKSPHGSMGIKTSAIKNFAFDPPVIVNVFVKFESWNSSGFKNIFITIVGRNFGGNELTSSVEICHEGFTRNDEGNYTGCFVPSISKYTHNEVECALGDDVSENGLGPFPGNVTLTLGNHSTFMKYFGRTPVIDEKTIESIQGMKFNTDGDATKNRVTIAVQFAGSIEADISIVIYFTPIEAGGTAATYNTITDFIVDPGDAERATFDFIIPQGQGKGVSLSVKRASQISEAIVFDYLKPSISQSR